MSPTTALLSLSTGSACRSGKLEWVRFPERARSLQRLAGPPIRPGSLRPQAAVKPEDSAVAAPGCWRRAAQESVETLSARLTPVSYEIPSSRLLLYGQR